MRKLLVIFLLVLMPVQLTWAAVAIYCQHDADVTTQHLGHHEHQHTDAGANDVDMDNAKSATGPHGDCGVCHAHGSLAVSRYLPSPVLTGMTSVQVHTVNFLPNSLVSQPERPKWARLA